MLTRYRTSHKPRLHSSGNYVRQKTCFLPVTQLNQSVQRSAVGCLETVRRETRYDPDKALHSKRQLPISHTGVLDVASTVLCVLYSRFPGPTNKVDPDKGLFTGPRPSVISSETTFQEIMASIPGLVLSTLSSELKNVRDIT